MPTLLSGDNPKKLVLYDFIRILIVIPSKDMSPKMIEDIIHMNFFIHLKGILVKIIWNYVKRTILLYITLFGKDNARKFEKLAKNQIIVFSIFFLFLLKANI